MPLGHIRDRQGCRPLTAFCGSILALNLAWGLHSRPTEAVVTAKVRAVRDSFMCMPGDLEDSLAFYCLQDVIQDASTI